MKRAWPGGASGNRPKASKGNSQKQDSTPPRSPANAPQDWPATTAFPVDDLHLRPMRSDERNLVVCVFWRLAREGVRLPAERGVIVINGGAP